MSDLRDLVEEFEDHKKLYCIEGSKGVQNLCKLVNGLGYSDPLHRMQYGDGCLGDLIEFFEDNPGSIEAVKEWIMKQNSEEWKENLECCLPERESDEDDDS